MTYTSQRAVAISLFMLIVSMAGSIMLVFFWAPAAALLGESSRIIYFHVPVAWVSVLAFTLSGIFSIIFLSDKKIRFALLEEKAFNSAVIGTVFSCAAVLSGSLWAKVMWGSFWNWDPRETSMLYLLLIYAAYFSLRISLPETPSRDRITSAYLILTMASLPFLVFLAPRMLLSLHPQTIINPDKKILLDDKMKITLFFCLFSFTLLYFHVLFLSNRISFLKRKIEDSDAEI